MQDGEKVAGCRAAKIKEQEKMATWIEVGRKSLRSEEEKVVDDRKVKTGEEGEEKSAEERAVGRSKVSRR
jgi:hypothetical protein